MRDNFIAHTIEKYGSAEQAVATLRAKIGESPLVSRLDLQVLLNAMGREAEAFQISNELFEIAPEDSRVRFNRGWHFIARGDLRQGMEFLEAGRKLNTYGHPTLPSSQPLWQRTFKNHRVHLVLEGGFGDEIIHFRFGRDLAEKFGCKVSVVCHPALAGIFGAQDWVAAVLQREAALGVYHDSWLPGMSAAFHLGYEYSDLTGEPYLNAPLPHINKWAPLLKAEGKLRVGIRWAGNPRFENQQLRLFPTELLMELRKFDGVQLFSFQRDHHLQVLPEGVVDLAPHLNTWEDTAGALSHMDLVISSCTSVAHCSASMGKPTWVIVPALPYYVWAKPGETSPWYKSVRLFRQKEFAEWEPVRAQLHEEFDRWRKNARP